MQHTPSALTLWIPSTFILNDHRGVSWMTVVLCKVYFLYIFLSYHGRLYTSSRKPFCLLTQSFASCRTVKKGKPAFNDHSEHLNTLKRPGKGKRLSWGLDYVKDVYIRPWSLNYVFGQNIYSWLLNHFFWTYIYVRGIQRVNLSLISISLRIDQKPTSTSTTPYYITRKEERKESLSSVW